MGLKPIKQLLKALIPRPLHPPLRYAKFRLAAWQTALGDRLQGQKAGGVPLPPPELRFRVHGSLDRESFLSVGATGADDLRRSLGLLQREIYSFTSVLDFGCGCGRVLRWFHDHPGSCRFYGTDIDRQAIAWARQALRFATFEVNPALPPLPFPAESFDLIYAISVFTHLDEEYQFAWLEELRRVARPRAVLVLTTHGEYAQSVLSAEEQEVVREKGFFFKRVESGRFRRDGLPDFYQASFHSRAYVLETWSRFFRILHYQERGHNNHQDLVVLQRD